MCASPGCQIVGYFLDIELTTDLTSQRDTLSEEHTNERRNKS